MAAQGSLIPPGMASCRQPAATGAPATRPMRLPAMSGWTISPAEA